ncbi:long-chain acyl-[acyl-carrier-protein] reductase [Synechococcus sp. PCC 7336]|uniref:long-chain acyl-[acyl-carrier-protein] reductase n=1 Tax=Synechococcus sp. PCC 7336 TaxID=195250 RepID=UPI00034C89E6|nr:long-chain acyl-[acyl-carrier-protein] reductase [Synechococcus sp. PCC 7336]
MFGLIGHLTDLPNAQRVAALLGYPEYADSDIDFWCMAPPLVVDDITVTSITGQKIHGQYVESCFLPEMLAMRKFKAASRKILNAMALAQKRNLTITALGGFSSIIFENFKLESLKRVRNIELELRRFTTGNTHTAYIICKQAIAAAKQHGLTLADASIAVVGATGDIGSGVCRWLNARTDVGKLLLVARDRTRLDNLKDSLGRGEICTLAEALPKADIIVWVASMSKGMSIDVQELRHPCIIIDGGYPKNLSSIVCREDAIVIDGGMVEHSLDIEWNIMNFLQVANPTRQLFACFAESMLLEFEGLHTNFSWGRNHITADKIDEIGRISRKHGFRALMPSV